MVKNAVDSLTEEQKHIANFWDDNPFKVNVSGHIMFSSKKFSPPGHWMSVVGIANKTAKADFETATYAYAKTAIALFDAFIHCWDAKYAFNTVRPETVINKYFDMNWRPLLQTPAFPEYTCGHSTISSSAAEVLTSVYGDNFCFPNFHFLLCQLPIIFAQQQSIRRLKLRPAGERHQSFARMQPRNFPPWMLEVGC